MRVGIVADPSSPGATEVIAAADRLGVDGVLIRQGSTELDGFVIAASLSGHGGVGLVVVEIEVGGHPIHLAEKAAVADQVLAGRLAVILRGSDRETLIESANTVSSALRARPFSTGRGRWPSPASIETNDVSWSAIRVTPTPSQLRLPIFVGGPAGRDAALAAGIPYFADVEDSAGVLGEHWDQMTSRYGMAADQMTRAGIRHTNGFDESSAQALVHDRGHWGTELVFLQREATAPWDRASVADLASRLKPRVSLDDLPAGLERFWDATIQT